MLDKKTRAVLAYLETQCPGGSFKVLEKQDIVAAMPARLALTAEEIDSIDSQMLELFCRRLDLAADVAAEKAKDHKPVFDPARERTKLLDIAQKAPERLQPQAVSLFSLLMSMNKAEQQRLLHKDDDSSLSASARASLKPIDEPFPATAMVACQGVEGAYSQIAATRLFHVPGIVYFNTFEGVFRAVRDGLCDFGVVSLLHRSLASPQSRPQSTCKARRQALRCERGLLS